MMTSQTGESGRPQEFNVHFYKEKVYIYQRNFAHMKISTNNDFNCIYLIKSDFDWLHASTLHSMYKVVTAFIV